ncbi:hypothetical protein Tco_0753262 [Tanacetum coccineum]
MVDAAYCLSPLFKEYFIAGNQSVLKPSSHSNNSTQQDTQPTSNVQPTIESITPTTTIHAEENNINQAANAQFMPYEFSILSVHRYKKLLSLPHIRRQLATDPEMCMLVLTVSTAELTTFRKQWLITHGSRRCKKSFISLTDSNSKNSLTNPLERLSPN